MKGKWEGENGSREFRKKRSFTGSEMKGGEGGRKRAAPIAKKNGSGGWLEGARGGSEKMIQRQNGGKTKWKEKSNHLRVLPAAMGIKVSLGGGRWGVEGLK